MSTPSAQLRSLQEFLRRLPLFAELTTSDVAQLCRSANRVSVKPGDLIIEEGAPGNSLFVVLSGEVEITKRDNDQEIVLASRGAGEFLGEMSLLEQSPRTASVRAIRDVELLEIGPDAFRRMLEANPAIAATVLRTMAGRLRSNEATLMQREKLASLGTLAAGLAHELNNPAAAIRRSSDVLREAFEKWRRCTVMLQALDLSEAERRRIVELEHGIAACGLSRPGDAATAREEDRLIEELEERGAAEPWEIAPPLVAYGWTVERVGELAGELAAPNVAPVIEWLGVGLSVQQLIEEIQRSSEAISQIVRAVKSYTYLDQAPVQEIDLQASLEDTLMILHHKLKQGVEVVRDFEPGLPGIEAHAGELNQVWTNLIDNAVQAMDGKGVLELGARRLGGEVEVRIADSGPGIPPEIRSRIFDPFFTTKPQGVGTGLGLHISHNIVVNRHRGRIEVASRPGRTEFRVLLPTRMKRAAPPHAQAAEMAQ